jgi:hypothetical protein
MNAQQVLDRHYLDVRARLLEIAATLDRIDRASDASDDPRLAQIRQGLEILESNQPERAAEIQQLFSQPYDPQWRSAYGI